MSPLTKSFKIVLNVLLIFLFKSGVAEEINLQDYCIDDFNRVLCKNLQFPETVVDTNAERIFSDTNILFINSHLLTIPRNLFQTLPNLIELVISDCHISELNTASFSNSDGIYAGNHMKILDLSKNQIRVLPENTFEHVTNLKQLDLSENQLSEINSNSFNGLQHLIELRMQNNNITHLDSAVFEPLINLKFIDLDNNQIEVISDDIFTNNVQLEYISLRFNNLQTFNENIIANIDNLNQLLLSRNTFLTQVSVSSVRTLDITHCNIERCVINGNVIYLYAWDNQISQLDINNLNNTEMIMLRNNSLANIENLKPANNLIELDLSNNLIQEINGETFSQMNQLLYLNLSTNRVSFLLDNSSDVFHSQSNLIELDLSNNNLNEFDGNLVKPLLNLESLYLNDNQLNDIVNYKVFKRLSKLRNLDLSNNNWNCSFNTNITKYLTTYSINVKAHSHQCDEE